MKKLTVELTNSRSYPIIIKEGALNESKTLLKEHLGAGRRYFVITNKTIAKIYPEFLKGFEKFDGFIDTILEQTYHSHVINRKTFQQHIDEISRSHFHNYVIDYWYRDQEPSPEDLARIKERFGEQRYDVRGIAVTAFKD